MTSRLVPLFLSALGAVICLGLGACKNPSKPDAFAAAGDSNIVDYAGLPKDELPFDEKGNYREDWVSGTRSSSGLGANASDSPYVQEDTPAPVKRTVASTSKPASRKPTTTAKTSSSSKAKPKSKPKTVAATSSASKTKSKPKAKAKPVAKTTLYKVAKGDTLSAISRKTGRSVASIKSYNGMKTDFLRDGWVIKLPPKK